MNIHFSAPSKTFLVGEYAVLNGGPALVMCTEPRFTLTVHSGSGKISGFHEASPAGLWLKQHKILLAEWDIEFGDPHSGAGGFGASGAQFLFAHVLVTLLTASVRRAVEGLDIPKLLTDYRSACGGAGSGVDIIAQATGRVARVVNGGGESLSWPYPDLDFAIVRTGQKVATHTHLAELNLESLKVLEMPARRAVECYGHRSGADFAAELRVFSNQLRALNLQASQSILEECEREPWCLVAKGCGALGADTFMVLFAPQDLPAVKQYFANREMNVAATSTDLVAGLEMKWSHS